MNVLACDSATKRIDLEVTFALKVGQLVCLTGSSGLSAQIPPNAPCWVVSASAVTGTSPRRQSITIAATVGGPALDPGNGPATANFFFWSLYDGESGETRIPVPGSLRPGEFAYVPWDAGGRTIYFRPWDDVPIGSATFALCQRNPTRAPIRIEGGNCQVLGGTVYGATGALAMGRGERCIGSGLWGTRLYGGGRGVMATSLPDSNGVRRAAKRWQAWYCEVSDIADHAFGAFGLMPDDGKTDMRVGWCWAHDTARLETDYVDAQGIVTNPGCDGLQAMHVLLERIGRDPSYKSPPDKSLNLGGLIIDESSDCLFVDCLLSDVYGEQVECGSGATAAPQRNLVTNCTFLLPAMPQPVPDRSPMQVVWRGFARADEPGKPTRPIDRSNVMSHCVVVLGDDMSQRTNTLDCGVVALRNLAAVPCEVTFTHNWVFGGAGANSCVHVLRQTLNPDNWQTNVHADGNLYFCPQVTYVGARVANLDSNWTPTQTWTPAQLESWQDTRRSDRGSAWPVPLGIQPDQILMQLVQPDGRRLDGMPLSPSLTP